MAYQTIPRGECPACHVPNKLHCSLDGLIRLSCRIAQQPLKQKDTDYCVLCRRGIWADQDAVDIKQGRAHNFCVFPGVRQ